ncbi:MAG: hypothetical protein K6B38_06770 [Ruminococcus sp.]|nr:hypothetical protein [Ruminococcus sp.]
MAILLIILKILLIILLAVLGIVLLVLIMPVGGEVSYIDGKLTYKVRLWMLNVMDSDGGGVIGWLKKRKKKPKKPKPAKPVKDKKKKKTTVDDDAYLDDFDFDADDADFEETAVVDVNSNAEVSESVSSEAETQSENDGKSENTEVAVMEDEEELPDNDDKRSLGDWAELGIGIWESAQRPLLKIFKGFHFKDLYIDFVIADEDAYDCALKYGKYSGMIYNIIAFMSTLFTVRLKTVDVGCGFGLKKGKWDISCKVFFRAGTAVIAGLWFLITYLTRTFIPDKIRKFKRKKQPQGRSEV